MDRDREFGEFVDARALVMRRTAYLLCGDWHRAEDIVQNALIKLYVAWSRVRRDSVDAYARKVLVRTAIDEGRRGWFQRERTVDVLPEPAVTDDSADFDLRLALDALPPGQRAVVVLRYWEDLSITETARILGRTEGTVKSQAAKGLAALRELLEDEPTLRIYRSEVIRKGKTKLVRRRTAIAGALAMVMIVGLGTTGYVLQSSMTMKDSGGTSAASGNVDRNAQLTALLQAGYRLPSGITAEDVPEINARAFTFFAVDSYRRAVARLRDTEGVGAVSITLDRPPTPSLGTCEGYVECQIVERNGISVHVSQMQVPGTPSRKVLRAVAVHSDGTRVEVTSDNVGRFTDTVRREADLAGEPQRSAPLLDREELIKIATLPGLTF
ncbi:SigE family RNA polymerase sigma factor [Lentzea sp. NPDC006480]|uniref:SigE family RNA polymerase sigma factor n=1 Tax=Lentzea sp. NPDC006480 TaxID=3157176 RepID=UPI0033B9D0D7